MGAVSGAVGGEEEIGRAPESLAPQAGLLRDASGSYVGYYAPLESPLQSPLLASIPLRENKGGSVRALTDLEGNITDTFSYDAYGNLLHPSSLFLPTSYLYRGERYDPDLGQYYLRARFYDADLGRFHTLDEYEGRTGEPLSLHKYLYAHANPVTGWDPSGRFSLGEMATSIRIQTEQLRRGTVSGQRVVNQVLRTIVTLAVWLNLATAAIGEYTGKPFVMAPATVYANMQLRNFLRRPAIGPKSTKRIFRISKFIAQAAAKAALVSSKALPIPVDIGINGLPDFNPSKPISVVYIPLTGSRSGDYALAHAKGRVLKRPLYTWHHHESVGIMMYVPTPVHAAVGHAGGVFFWELLNDRK